MCGFNLDADIVAIRPEWFRVVLCQEECLCLKSTGFLQRKGQSPFPICVAWHHWHVMPIAIQNGEITLNVINDFARPSRRMPQIGAQESCALRPGVCFQGKRDQVALKPKNSAPRIRGHG